MSKALEGKAATQERILVAATELFLESGYDGAIIAAVAERAGVSRATVFWHFGDKAGLFQAAFARILEPFQASLARDFTDLDPEKRLHEQIAISEQFSREHGEEIAAFIRWAVAKPNEGSGVVTTLFELNQRFAGALTESVEALGPDVADPKLVALGLMLAFDANLVLSLFDSRPQANEELSAAVQALTDLIVSSAGNAGRNRDATALRNTRQP